jgi:hypothetical protein
METSNAFDVLMLPLLQCLGCILAFLMFVRIASILIDRVFEALDRSAFDNRAGQILPFHREPRSLRRFGTSTIHRFH